MPLVDLKTDLKSLKYGKDRPGGGSSKQPFVQTSAKNSFDLPVSRLGNNVAGIPAGPDFILRGGLLAPVRAAKDVSRLVQLFTQTSRGLQFTAKMNVLSRASVETEASIGPGYGFNAVNQGIYTPLSTFLQAGSGWAGTHLNLLGIDPTGLTPYGLLKYEDVVKVLNSEVSNGTFSSVVKRANPNFQTLNATPPPILGALPPQETITITNGEPEFINETVTTEKYTNRLLKLTREKINEETNDPNILSYSGGPGSILGYGKTHIKFDKNQRTGINNVYAKNPSKAGFFYGTDKPNIDLNYSQILAKGVSTTSGITLTQNNLSENNGKFTEINLADSKYYTDRSVSGNPDIQPLNLTGSLGVSVSASLDPETDNFISPDGKSLDRKLATDPYYLDRSKTGNLEVQELNLNNSLGFSKPFENLLSPDGKPLDKKSATDSYYIDRSKSGNLDVQGLDLNNSLGASNQNIPGTTQSLNAIRDNYINSSGQFVPQSGSDYDAASLSRDEIDRLADQSRQGSIRYFDFRTGLKKKDSSGNPTNAYDHGTAADSINYNTKYLDTRVNIGDQGNPLIERGNYTKGGGSARLGVDKINALYMYTGSFVTPSSVKNDLVKFRIATINPDNPQEKTYTHFRAFINEISDQFGAEWDSYRYMGRAENFYNYTGFNRSMNLSWTVAALSKEELSIMYQKLNYLASTLAPNYSRRGWMRGNIHHLTVGGYVFEMPGIIESLDFTIPNDSPWEISIPVNEFQMSRESKQSGISSDSTVKELPHRIEVSMAFKPIHPFLPQTVGSSFDWDNEKGIFGGSEIDQRFLSLQDHSQNGENDLYSDNATTGYVAVPSWTKVNGAALSNKKSTKG